jgi:predicted DNA-binding protein YlxM (UPF0122 family)
MNQTLTHECGTLGYDYHDIDRMQIAHRDPAVLRYADYTWALNDKTVQKVIATHIAVIACARAVPDTLEKLRLLDTVAVDHLSRKTDAQSQKCAATARRVGGLAPYYAALIYRAIRLGADSCELAEEFQVKPCVIRQVLYGLNQVAQKLEAGEPLLPKYRSHYGRRKRGQPGRLRTWNFTVALKLRQDGLSYREIAAKFNVADVTVSQAFVKAGILSPRPVSRPQPKAQKYSPVECIELYRAGWKMKELAEKYGVRREAIGGCIKRWGRTTVESVARQSSTPTPQL